MVSQFCKKASGFSQGHVWVPMAAKKGFLKCANGCGSQMKQQEQHVTRYGGKGTVLDELAGQPVRGTVNLIKMAAQKRKEKKEAEKKKKKEGGK